MLHPFVILNPSLVILNEVKNLRVNSRRISCIIRFFGLRPQNDNRGRAS